MNNHVGENLYTTNKIRTFTGKYLDVFNPDPDCIDIVDIAHSLSLQCRWGGHCKRFYSVAQHSFSCYALAPEGLKFEALMHDASEAYLCDIPRPIKYRLPDYKQVEDNLMRVIANKFGFDFPIPTAVKNIDKRMLETEWECIVLSSIDSPFFPTWDSHESRVSFLKAFNLVKR